ncbi:Helicase conserved C-terminal domain-containing protein [Pseudarthrobacter equi]|uniref:Helicase conserved C-terminal domain-containing protein n=1 Tax=Pseudarthrobacter equi TaxID=728066 RepID=A0A1H1WQW9_9MICC|nr:DEAD/DEAH box helicase [Pseudarthrobacter equi]SDS99422.1 Helicase conserved C-terminal domain-containing protein [Pseudarthrobacter equi]
MAKTIGTGLSERIVASEVFVDSFRQLERMCAETFLLVSEDPSSQDASGELDVPRLLRFADILSHSELPLHRELAYTVVALLHELVATDMLDSDMAATVSGFTEAIMIELGNFPAIKTLRRRSELELVPPQSKEVTRALKHAIQETSQGDSVFTDAQATIVRSLEGASFFSFSGPTSLGKSFIIKDTLFGLVQKPELENRSIVVLVPTKALITQTVADLREVLAGLPEVHISPHPQLSYFLRKQFSRTVFVFTPERLLSYLPKAPREIDYLFVDEAQKVISEHDTRSPLYYHAINETLRKFATKLIFASPNIDNPEIFLQLFQKSSEGSIAVPERTVSQRRYLVDFVDRKVSHFEQHFGTADNEYPIPPQWSNKFDVVRDLSRSNQSIVYINSARGTVMGACEFADSLPERHDPRLSSLAAFAAENVHEDYYLIRCLKKGVAFHHGRMPQDLRDKIEELFSATDSPLQFVFCTSTLLEGVNLPAKNIFVLSDRHGLKMLTRLDFENLIGRAGRLTYDFSGNVVCIRDKATTWQGTTRELIRGAGTHKAESFLVNPRKGRKKEYTDIERVLTGKPLPKGRSEEARKATEQYASILTLHELYGQSSPLKDYFVDRIDNAKDILKKVSQSIAVPQEILRNAPDIPSGSQDGVWNRMKADPASARLVPADADLTKTSTYHAVLLRLYSEYDWNRQESTAPDSLVPKRKTSMDPITARLRYWANLMRNWTSGKPLSQIIKGSIRYYETNGEITFRDFDSETTYTTETFIRSDPRHINLVIEETLLDIEVGLRFKIMRYLQNHYELARLALGEDEAGMNLASLVEYGTSDVVAIALQDAGLSRGAALKVASDFAGYVQVADDGDLINLKIDELINAVASDAELLDELTELFPRQPIAKEVAD